MFSPNQLEPSSLSAVVVGRGMMQEREVLLLTSTTGVSVPSKRNQRIVPHEPTARASQAQVVGTSYAHTCG